MDHRNQYFGASIVVATKHFNLNGNNFGITAGYGTDLLRNNQLKYFAGGVYRIYL